jgi:enamine deaminase RidA (YjgF/YER057c/UK114 family)
VTNSNRYLNIVQTGNLIYLSGKGPLKADGNYVTGKVGGSLTTEQGTEAARLCAIHLLAVLKQELGSLSKVKRIVKVTGFVNSTPDFTNQPKVMDGFSLLLDEIFGDAGKHARSAVGVTSLPFGWAVEGEMIVEVTP